MFEVKKKPLAFGTRLVHSYKKISLVGKGTYGKVWKAKGISGKFEGKLVALKRIEMVEASLKTTKVGKGKSASSKEAINRKLLGITLPYFREFKLVQSCDHPNIISLLEIVTSNKSYKIFRQDKLSLYMVFEYFPYDLRGLTSIKHDFTDQHIIVLFHQLLSALSYLHLKNICHRDLKTANILLSKSYQLKLTDFGLARTMGDRLDVMIAKDQEHRLYTNNVVTIFYKAPELLIGDRKYDYKIDIWAAGCILFEMFTEQIAFPGNDEMSVLSRIAKFLGAEKFERNEYLQDLPGYHSLGGTKIFRYARQLEEVLDSNPHFERYRNRFGSSEPEFLQFLGKMWEIDPTQRLSASELLRDVFFVEDYAENYQNPATMGTLQLKGGWSNEDLHELEAKTQKKALSGPTSIIGASKKVELGSVGTENKDLHGGELVQGKSLEKERPAETTVVTGRNPSKESIIAVESSGYREGWGSYASNQVKNGKARSPKDSATLRKRSRGEFEAFVSPRAPPVRYSHEFQEKSTNPDSSYSFSRRRSFHQEERSNRAGRGSISKDDHRSNPGSHKESALQPKLNTNVVLSAEARKPQQVKTNERKRFPFQNYTKRNGDRNYDSKYSGYHRFNSHNSSRPGSLRHRDNQHSSHYRTANGRSYTRRRSDLNQRERRNFDEARLDRTTYNYTQQHRDRKRQSYDH
eukprot:augustus_masked-scaffold_13-processed-gene-0.10-mRNA-1 protein AED:0.37 eAED:0.37 QI:0/-1/0/1/-1/1/1/0/689